MEFAKSIISIPMTIDYLNQTLHIEKSKTNSGIHANIYFVQFLPKTSTVQVTVLDPAGFSTVRV